MPYSFLRDTHSLLRWVVIVACLWALMRVWSGFFGRSEWTRKDQMAGLVFTSLLNVQLILGLILYAISPITRAAMTNFAAAMKDSTLRFLRGRTPGRHVARCRYRAGWLFHLQKGNNGSW